jgi:hypothetical protein
MSVPPNMTDFTSDCEKLASLLGAPKKISRVTQMKYNSVNKVEIKEMKKSQISRSSLLKFI